MSQPSDPQNGGRVEQQYSPPTDMQPSARFGGPPPEPARSHKRPWGWIAGCAVLLLVAAGLAVWAVNLNSDLSDQKDQTAQAQQQAKDANAAANDLSTQLDQITQDVNNASDQLQQAGQNAQSNAQAAIDGLKGKLSSVKDQVTQRLEKLKSVGAQPTPTP